MSDLTPAQWEAIRATLARHGAFHQAILFGSRAKGTAHAASDIDLAVVGSTDPVALGALLSDLEALPMPWRFDVVALEGIHNPALREHIDRVGQVVYTRG